MVSLQQLSIIASNCFRKSTILSTTDQLRLPMDPAPPDLGGLYQQVTTAGNIRDSMAVSNFLNPEEEGQELEAPMDANQILEDILATQKELQEDEDDNQQQPERQLPSITDAQRSLSTLIDFLEGQESVKPGLLRDLEVYEKALHWQRVQGLSQGNLDGWLVLD